MIQAKAAKNHLEILFFYNPNPNQGSELVQYSMAQMLLYLVKKGLLFKNLEKYKVTQGLILGAHNLAAQPEKEDPVFQFFFKTNPSELS